MVKGSRKVHLARHGDQLPLRGAVGHSGVCMMEVVKVEAASPLQTEVVVAANLRERMTACLVAACAVMDLARASGMDIRFNIGVDGFGRNRVTVLDIVKPL